MRSRSSIASIFGILASCGTTNTMQGKVTTMPHVAADGSYVPERPLADARVVLECDTGQRPTFSVNSDTAGKVLAQFDHVIPATCRIRVSAAGFRERTFRVADACATDDRDGCGGISLSARLLPSAGR